MTDRDVNTEMISDMGGPSHEVIALGYAYKSNSTNPAQILDLGCGDGRNAFFLSGVGARVTAIDISESNVHKLNALSQDYSRDICAIVSDVAHWEFSSGFDSVLAHGILHFLDRDSIFRLILSIQRHTANGGYNIYTVSPFSSKAEVLDEFLVAGHQNALMKGELLKLYGEWELISHEFYRKRDFHPGTGEHCHPVEKVIFRKSGGGAPLLESTRIPLGSLGLADFVSGALANSRLIGLEVNNLISRVGSPERRYTYTAEGPQFGFKHFCKAGYCLELLIYGHLMVYVSNGIVSGISEFESDFFELKPFGPSLK